MATSLLTLLDDITSILDDVATVTKVAARKTAGVLGDDLALNAQQVSGVNADRELPVVWAVAKGSARNKLILVPAALAISALLPWAVTPLLMLGGLYLCYEGVEKLAHGWLYPASETATAAPAEPASEADKIKGAVRTDFVLSAEIIVIALGTVAAAPLLQQFAVLAGVSVLMTAGVYGLVAGIVKLDDLGLYLQRQSGPLQFFGGGLLAFAPWLMKTLSVVGTAAMFLVGGGILAHGLPLLHGVFALVGGEGLAASVWSALVNVVIGVLAGVAALLVVQQLSRLRR